MQAMKHYLEEPSPAVRTQLETMKRLPRLQICVLNQVLSLMRVTQEKQGSTVEIRQVRHGRGLEAFELNLRTKKQRMLRLIFSAEWRGAAELNGAVQHPPPGGSGLLNLKPKRSPPQATGPQLTNAPPPALRRYP